MALVNVQEKWSERNGSFEQTNVLGAQQGSATRVFTVLYDAGGTSRQLDAIDAAGIPNIGALHPDGYTWLTCRRKRAVPLGPLLFNVICEYWGKDSPLTEPAEKYWEDATSTEPTDRDGDGALLTNTVGHPVTGLSKSVSDPVYVFRQNEASYPAATMQAYWNRVNSDVFKTWGANQARMLPITAQRLDVGTIYYWPTTYRIQFRTDGWNHRYPNEGKFYRPTAGAPFISARDTAYGPKVLLNADGTMLNGNGAEDPGGDPSVWITRPVYPEIAFAPLGIS